MFIIHRRLYCFLICLMMVQSYAVEITPGEPNKLALIIAIGAYDKATSGWSPISSQNDVPLIRSALNKLGFDNDNISLLKDQEATKEGILTAINELANKANQGDLVVIHFSSHGQQIFDDNNDELDNLDEAVVAYGAPVNERVYRANNGSRARYDGSLHLRDETLGTAILEVRSKLGKDGHVLVTMDNCHSGTGTRGTAKTRGGEAPLIPEWVEKKSSAKKDDAGGLGFYDKSTTSRGATDNLAKFVLISGASADELNYETQDDDGNNVGSLSYCVSKVLQKVPEGATYRSLFANIKSEMAIKAPRQAPQIEGDIDYEIFGGRYIAQQKYFALKQVNGEIRIDAGKLNGIAIGSTVSVEKAGATGPGTDGKSLATGKVISATNFDATIELDRELKLANSVDAWVFVTSQMVPEISIKVNLDSVLDDELKVAMTKAINDLAIAEIVSTAGDLKVKSVPARGAYAFEIFNSAYNSSLLGGPAKGNDYRSAAEVCTNTIQNYAQGQLFKMLELEDPAYAVSISRALPVKAGSKNLTDTLDYREIMDKGGFVNIKAGSYIFLELKNEGDYIVYFNIVDIEPSGKINPLLPSVNRSGNVMPNPEELMLKPREKKILKYPIGINPPYGNEMFKVISTSKPFDLGSTINTKGMSATARGARGESPAAIEVLLGKSFDKSFTSRGASLDEEAGGTNTFAFPFRIVK